jgi:hypothetical protein
MDLSPLSTRITCPRDDGVAVLLVDVETESVPYTDEDGNPLYYCPEGQHLVTCHRNDAWGGGKARALPVALAIYSPRSTSTTA